MDELTLQ
jgi:hypothetical protein